MRTAKSMIVAVVLVLLSGACFGGGSGDETGGDSEADDALLGNGAETDDPVDDGDPADDPSGSGDPTDELIDSTADHPCEGGAFPGDDEFRELVCAVQWAQLDLVSGGGDIDPSWGTRASEAILLYATDRDAAVAELEAVLAEMGAAVPTTDTADAASVDADDAIALGEETAGLQDCMVEVAQLIVEANVSAGFDPARIDEWQADAEQVEDLVGAGDIAGAEALVCELRDEIATAIEDPSLVP